MAKILLYININYDCIHKHKPLSKGLQYDVFAIIVMRISFSGSENSQRNSFNIYFLEKNYIHSKNPAVILLNAKQFRIHNVMA